MIQELEEHAIDMFHVDSNDKHEVFKDIETIRKYSGKLIDLHIITSSPEAFFEKIEKYKPDFVTFQYENIKKKLELPKIDGVKFGLSIIADTPNEEIEEHIAAFDFILFMATVPGESGGEFDKRIFKKILKFQKKHPDKKVHVDGGVNGEVSFILRNMGCLLYTSPSPRDRTRSRMPSSA